MNRRLLPWLLALAVLAAGVYLVAGRSGDREAPQVLAAEQTTTTQPGTAPSTATAQPSTTTTTSPTTTTVAPSTTTTVGSTTTTSPPTTTTTVPPPTTTSVAPSDYAFVPKPAPGLNTVAPGGALTKHLAADIAAAFGFETATVEAAIGGVDLPPEAGGNPEGWLAPGTYQPAEGATAADVVQAMVDRRVEQLEQRGIPRAQWRRVLTAASVIEKETYNQTEKPRVARVLANRLAGGGKLQMDSIILYPVPEDRIFTTAAERASNQPYNSYEHNGLPPTPISAPDEASIDAFLSPPPGSWWFYVTINLHTGETLFANTYEQHQANAALLY
ncbi:MAG: endolytic transglycosylase MltG, partial [Acidimicrobiia bacterium]|nr:endolytic transglycosylase MltG [Acidimicrobiia bacterium]